jgi:hypothetical protein
MNNIVVLPVSNAGEACNIVQELKGLGLLVDRDFVWRFQPSIITNYPTLNAEEEIGDEVVVAPSVTFTFVEESMASFIRLKWS